MSDFDEEAERERLREQFEREEEKRETTERMSELLLKGATMTNGHCGTCGDPIFRYEGQEFCPTCQEVVSEADPEQEAAEGQDEGTAGDADVSQDGQVGESGEAVASPGTAETSTDDSATGPHDESASDLPERHERARVPDRDRRPTDAPARPDPPALRDPEEGQRQTDPGSTGDLADARASLRRSLVRFAREAEHTDDPRRAREYLEAAHEAAEALVSISEIR